MLIREKINQAKDILREFNTDCWMTFVRESQINGDPALPFLVEADLTWHSALIITRQGKAIAIVGQYDKQMVEELGVYDRVIGFVTGVKEPLQEVMQEINPRQIAVNYSVDSEICDGITHGMYLTLEKILGEMGYADRLVSAEKIVSALRQRKTATELKFMKEAIRQTEEIFDLVAGFIRPGRSEAEIAAFMKAEVTRRGLEFGWEEKVCPAVFSGPQTAEAHYQPTDRQVAGGHLLNMDFGVKYEGYCSDLQRTFYVLRPGETEPPADVRRGFETLVTSIELAKEAIRPGQIGLTVDKVCREYIVSRGYPEFPHALGHQVGRFSHDGTAILGPAWEKYASKPFEKLEEGMVFTIEPRLTVPGHGIVSIENMVLVTADGAEWLSTPQTELLLIPA